MKLGKYFTLSELTKSATAKEHKIDNTPGAVEKANLALLVQHTLDPLRELLGRPITVTNGFRNEELNKKVGGVPSSQHLMGEAADIKVAGMSPDQVVRKLLASNILFDQVIEEYGSWVHISFRRGRLRREALRYRKVKGKTLKEKFV